MAVVTVKSELKTCFRRIVLVVSSKRFEHIYFTPLFFILELLPAGGTLFILEKLHLTAARVLTLNHQSRSADLASLVDKGLLTACRAGDKQGSPAPGTDLLVFLDGTQTSRAGISKRAATPAFWTEPDIPVNELSTMYTGLFVKSHDSLSTLSTLFFTLPETHSLRTSSRLRYNVRRRPISRIHGIR